MTRFVGDAIRIIGRVSRADDRTPDERRASGPSDDPARSRSVAASRPLERRSQRSTRPLPTSLTLTRASTREGRNRLKLEAKQAYQVVCRGLSKAGY